MTTALANFDVRTSTFNSETGLVNFEITNDGDISTGFGGRDFRMVFKVTTDSNKGLIDRPININFNNDTTNTTYYPDENSLYNDLGITVKSISAVDNNDEIITDTNYVCLSYHHFGQGHYLRTSPLHKSGHKITIVCLLDYTKMEDGEYYCFAADDYLFANTGDTVETLDDNGSPSDNFYVFQYFYPPLPPPPAYTVTFNDDLNASQWIRIANLILNNQSVDDLPISATDVASLFSNLQDGSMSGAVHIPGTSWVGSLSGYTTSNSSNTNEVVFTPTSESSLPLPLITTYPNNIIIITPVVSASATGDPYITPIYGNLYKLPNRTAFYRLLKHNDTIINGEVVRFDEAQINYDCALRNFQMDKFAPDNFDFSSMYFFKNIYISHNGKETVYNLLDKTFTIDCFKHEITQTKLETCKIYYYENMEACEIDLDGIKIKLCTFDNPQIITGIELKANKDLSKASGLLVHQQSSKPHMLKNIKSKKETYKVEKQGRVVKEQFFTKTATGSETNIRDITVL